jgi:chromosome segregation ATPase
MKSKTELKADMQELQKQLQARQQTILMHDGQYQFLVGRIVQIQADIGEEKKVKEEV